MFINALHLCKQRVKQRVYCNCQRKQNLKEAISSYNVPGQVMRPLAFPTNRSPQNEVDIFIKAQRCWRPCFAHKRMVAD